MIKPIKGFQRRVICLTKVFLSPFFLETKVCLFVCDYVHDNVRPRLRITLKKRTITDDVSTRSAQFPARQKACSQASATSFSSFTFSSWVR